MPEELTPALITVLGGLAIGLVIGSVGRWSKFCTYCAIREWIEEGSNARARSWALAVAVAIVGSQALQISGLVDLNETIYLAGPLGWGGAVIGGLTFGIGMALVGSCGFSLVIRSGAGDFKAIIAMIVLGLSAYMAARGLTGLARVTWIDPLSADVSAIGGQGLPDILAWATGSTADAVRLPVAAALAALLAAWAFASRDLRSSFRLTVPAIIIGATAVAGFYITGYLGFDEFEPTAAQSATYIMPTGNALLYLLTFTGSTIDFGIALIGGTIAGAFLVALASRRFSVQTFADSRETARILFGAFLMGTGGVTALGCTFGQGITGVSTLSASSFLAIAAIIAGAAATVALRKRAGATAATAAYLPAE